MKMFEKRLRKIIFAGCSVTAVQNENYIVG